MNFRTISIALVMVVMAFTVKAQDKDVKIGYTNIELILIYMPDVKDVEKQISSIQQNMAKQMQTKEAYAQQKLQEYMTAAEAGTLSDEDKKTKEEELMKLDGELQKFAEDAEMEIIKQREKLLGPILDRLQETIDQVAEENAYTYILNQTTSGGVSTILFGPEQNDVTEMVMKKLGIEIPTGEMPETELKPESGK